MRSAKMGLVISEPLGFDDTYALAVKESFARGARSALHQRFVAGSKDGFEAGVQLRIHGSQGWLSGDGGSLSLALGAAADQSHGAQP